MGDREILELGALVVIENRDGFWTVASDAKGWITASQGDETIKVRPGAVELVPDVEDEDEDETVGMSKTLDRYKPGYFETTTYRGTRSLNNGDTIARLLAGLEPGTVALMADRVLEEHDGYHAARYANLNPGQIRMNSGNRIRAHSKKGQAELDDVVEVARSMGIVDKEDEEAAEAA